MSTLQTRPPLADNPAAQVPATPTITVHAPARRPSDETPVSHAWSIGTTRLAQKPAQQPAPVRHMAYCPPEVYIG